MPWAYFLCQRLWMAMVAPAAKNQIPISCSVLLLGIGPEGWRKQWLHEYNGIPNPLLNAGPPSSEWRA